jgi:glycosyltransferase involved in cell wall biosynthesis
VKILSVFNHYLQPGGESVAVDAISTSLEGIVDLQRCEFFSADWKGPRSPAKWRQAFSIFRNPESVRRLRLCESARRSDLWLVHNVIPVASLAVYPEAKRLGVPVVQYVHNFRPFSVSGYLWAANKVAVGGLKKNYWQEVLNGTWQDSKLKTAWLGLNLNLGHALGYWKSVNAWIAISEFMRQKFILAGVPAERTFTLRHFWRSEIAENRHLGDHYLFLGRLLEAKGVHVLLDAWQLLEREHGESAPTLILCGDGPLRQSLAARVAGLKHVEMRGQVSGGEKDDLLHRAKAVVVPSLSWEALGLTVYESFEYARPVLVAKSGGLPELVEDQVTGIIHEPGDASQLAQHVWQMENNPEARVEMGRSGKSWLLSNADEGAWQTRFLEIAKYAIGSGAAPCSHQEARS